MEHRLDETETTINQLASNRSRWTLGTNDPVWKARMQKLGIPAWKTCGDWFSYELTDKHVTTRLPLALSEEESERRREVSKKNFEKAPKWGSVARIHVDELEL